MLFPPAPLPVSLELIALKPTLVKPSLIRSPLLLRPLPASTLPNVPPHGVLQNHFTLLLMMRVRSHVAATMTIVTPPSVHG